MDELSDRTRRTCRAGGLCGRAALFAGGVALGAVEDGSLVEVARGATGDAGVVVELFWLRGGAGTAGAESAAVALSTIDVADPTNLHRVREVMRRTACSAGVRRLQVGAPFTRGALVGVRA